MSSLPAGWYKDPADPATQRYWDGEGWLGKAIPADAVPPDGPPPADETPTAEPAPRTAQRPTPSPPQAWAPPGRTAPGRPPQGQQPPAQQPPGYPPPGYPAPPQGWTPPPGYPPPPPGWAPPPGYPMPYAYPVQARPHGFPLAGMGSRLVARLIDITAVLLLNVLVNGFLGYQWWLEVEPVFRAAMADPFGTPEQPSARSDYLMLTMLFVATALWLAYEVPATGNTGQTLGKRVMRIKVMPLDNTDRLGNARAFRRWARLGMWTPFWSCYGLGFVVQLIDSVSLVFDPKLRQALHDKTAGTVVVALPPGHSHDVEATKGGDASGGEK